VPTATPELIIEVPHLEEYWYIAYVDDVRKVDVAKLYEELKKKLEEQGAKDVVLLGITVDYKANSVTFMVMHPSSPVPWTVVALVIFAIASLLAAIAVVVYVFILYHKATQRYYCTICQAGPFTFEEFCAHLASKHPDVWERVKDYIKPPEAAPAIKWEYLVYGAIAVAAVIGIASLVRAAKK